jgi:hypothetical protein
MTRRTQKTWRAAIVLGALVAACKDGTITTPNPQGDQAADPVLQSRAGFQVRESRMRALLTQVTREVAVALSDDRLRQQIFTELHASPYRENKLHLNTLLRGPGQPLLHAMATARGAAAAPGAAPGDARAEAVLATLDSIVDLEFYMPVKEHFAVWRGEGTLLVASTLRDDGTPPVAFDPTGRRVTLLSAEDPPATPTLGIVPVETDFSRLPRTTAPSGVDAATTDIAGVYMTTQQVFETHEGFLLGAPEFEVHLFQTDIDMEYIDVICAGQEQVPPYQYNTEQELYWNGEVLLATEGRLALSPNNQFQLWEDDTGPCTPTGGRPPDTESATVSQYATWASAILNLVTAEGTVATIRAVLNFVPATYNFASAYLEDDEVGTFTIAGGCWGAATGRQQFDIISSKSGHPLTGWATLEYRMDATREPLCPPPPPPPPTPNVTINGASYTQPYSQCEYWTNVYGGTAPYHYAWEADGSPVGGNNSYYFHTAGENSFTLAVTVTDANGAVGGNTYAVTVDPAAGYC